MLKSARVSGPSMSSSCKQWNSFFIPTLGNENSPSSFPIPSLHSYFELHFPFSLPSLLFLQLHWVKWVHLHQYPQTENNNEILFPIQFLILFCVTVCSYSFPSPSRLVRKSYWNPRDIEKPISRSAELWTKNNWIGPYQSGPKSLGCDVCCSVEWNWAYGHCFNSIPHCLTPDDTSESSEFHWIQLTIFILIRLSEEWTENLNEGFRWGKNEGRNHTISETVHTEFTFYSTN